LTNLTYEILHLFPGDWQIERNRKRGRDREIKSNR